MVWLIMPSFVRQSSYASIKSRQPSELLQQIDSAVESHSRYFVWLAAPESNQRQIVFVTGEAGIGKTALANYFKGQAAADVPGIQIACGQ
jgi:2-phosphoglycerate kinase